MPDGPRSQHQRDAYGSDPVRVEAPVRIPGTTTGPAPRHTNHKEDRLSTFPGGFANLPQPDRDLATFHRKTQFVNGIRRYTRKGRPLGTDRSFRPGRPLARHKHRRTTPPQDCGAKNTQTPHTPPPNVTTPTPQTPPPTSAPVPSPATPPPQDCGTTTPTRHHNHQPTQQHQAPQTPPTGGCPSPTPPRLRPRTNSFTLPPCPIPPPIKIGSPPSDAHPHSRAHGRNVRRTARKQQPFTPHSSAQFAVTLATITHRPPDLRPFASS